MKKYIILFLTIFILSGCGGIIPKVNFNTSNTVPQQTEKSKKIMKCKGEIVLDDYGRVLSCTDGFYSNENLYNKQERKMTITERVKSFVNNLMGWGFWGLLLLLFLCPSVIGLVAGRLIEGTVGITGKALKSTVTAIKKAKRNGGHFMEELDREHNKDKKVQRKINELRAED